jgi:thiamine transport system ATP-binding protein
MLRLENIRFSHPGQPHPYRFDLAVPPGSIIGVNGLSGAGKSTLLDLIAGFLRPLTGTMTLNGDDLIGLAPQQRPVSILFQADNLFDHLDAAKNLALVLPPATNGAERGKSVATALARVALEGFERRRAASLSGGQKQRLALARTLLLDRPVLLLDEPFSALDTTAAAEMGALVKSMVAQNGWHCVLVSHQRAALDDLADTIVELRDGKLEPEI